MQTTEEKSSNDAAHDRLDFSIHDVSSHLDKHEAVCVERYKTVESRLNRLEMILLAFAGTALTLLLTLVAEGALK